MLDIRNTPLSQERKPVREGMLLMDLLTPAVPQSCQEAMMGQVGGV